MATTSQKTQRRQASHKMDRRFGTGRGKKLDAGGAGPIVVEIFRGSWAMFSSGRYAADRMMVMIINIFFATRLRQLC